MKKAASKDATDTPGDTSTTPPPSSHAPSGPRQGKHYQLLVTTRGPEFQSVIDQDGATVLMGEFRCIDWDAPRRLGECSVGVAHALGGDAAVVGEPKTWLGNDNGHLTYGVLFRVTAQIEPAHLRDGICVFLSYAMRDAPLAAPAQIPEAAQQKIKRLALQVAAAAPSAPIETPSSITIEHELPIEVWGRWSVPERTPCPDTHHQMTVGWDGMRFSRRTLYVFDGEDPREIGYDEVQWEPRLREVFGAVAQGIAPTLHIEFRTVTMGKRKLHVLTGLEIVPAEERQELTLA